MADLKNNYKDDVLDVTQNELRKYNVVNNDDGTISLIDVTKYSQTGDKFGAKDVNGIVEAIGETNSNLGSTTQTMNEHKGNTSNPHEVTKEQVGLGNVLNVSTNNQTPTYTVSPIIAALSSGEKLSTAFGKIAKAVNKLIGHLDNINNPHSVTKSQVGLSEVDNTSDLNKPVSIAQQNAINDAKDVLRQEVDTMLYTKTISMDNIEIDANGTIDVAFSTNLKTNESLIGLVGYNISNASSSGFGGSYGTIFKMYVPTGTEDYSVSIRNLNTSKAINLKIYLYVLVQEWLMG